VTFWSLSVKRFILKNTIFQPRTILAITRQIFSVLMLLFETDYNITKLCLPIIIIPPAPYPFFNREGVYMPHIRGHQSLIQTP